MKERQDGSLGGCEGMIGVKTGNSRSQFTRRLPDIILVLVFLMAVSTILLSSVFAFKLAVIRSGSMEPAMPVGTLVVWHSVDPADIEVGDVIAFSSSTDADVTVSHRVVDVLDSGFRTKGDANTDVDLEVVSASDVVGKVDFDIPYVGSALVHIEHFIHTSIGFTLLIGIPTVLLVGSIARDIYRRSRGAKIGTGGPNDAPEQACGD